MNKKRVLSILLALCMMISSVSIGTVAEATDSTELVNVALLANGATISSSYDRGSTFQPLEYMFEDSPGHSEYGKWGYTNTHADWENEPIDLEIQLNGTYQIS